MLLHYPGKLKNQKSTILTFQMRLFIIYPTDVMKINAKINSMQNTNILLFVRLLLLRYWKNA